MKGDGVRAWYFVALILFLLPTRTKTETYSNEEIVKAIYKAEGEEEAVKPFGILSVECNGYDECRQVCLNTVRNNRKRFKKYGYKKYDTYLEFLASRYAPIDASNDPNNLNVNWLRLVKYFLTETKGGDDA